MSHQPIFNPCYSRQLLRQLCCGNARQRYVVHESIFNATCKFGQQFVGFWIACQNLQHVAATRCCVKSRHVRRVTRYRFLTQRCFVKTRREKLLPVTFNSNFSTNIPFGVRVPRPPRRCPYLDYSAGLWQCGWTLFMDLCYGVFLRSEQRGFTSEGMWWKSAKTIRNRICYYFNNAKCL